MKNWLSTNTKKRVIRELKKILYDHPRFRADSENVSDKFSFDQRFQRGIIVNGTSAERIRLAADNYVGRLSSFCMLTWVDNHPGTSLEWVRENFPALEKISRRRDIFPSAPGVYFVRIRRIPDLARGIPGLFTLEPVLTVFNEPLIVFSSSIDQEAQISRDNLYEGSARLWLNERVCLVESVDFVVDYPTGAVRFLKPTPTGSAVYADYRYKAGECGPYEFQQEEPNVEALPGAVLAFGDRTQECDQQAIVITDERTDVAEVYGGKFEVNFELVAFARDTDERSRLSDYVVIKILELQNSLGYEGLELLDISPGGESEEVYNAEDDTYFYQSTLSLSMRVDWEVHIPLPVVITRGEFTSRKAERQHGYLDGSAPLDLLQVAGNLGLTSVPIVIGRQIYYERVR